MNLNDCDTEELSLYTFPLIGVVLGIEPGVQLIRYMLTVYGKDDNGSFVPNTVVMLAATRNEEQTDSEMASIGEISDKEYLVNEIRKLEETAFSKMAADGEKSLAQ